MKLKLACYFPAEWPSFIVINIDSDAYVEQLSEAVYEKLKIEDQDVQLQDLCLYKADIPIKPDDDLHTRALRWLHLQPLQARLDVAEKLATFFPAAPSRGTLHILVADPSIVDPDAPYIRRVQKALGKLIDDLSSGHSPSEVVQNAKGVAAFLDPEKGRVYLDRVPVAMFSPPLARLQQRFDGLDSKVEPSPAEVACAAEFLGAAIDFFKNEDLRLQAIYEYIDALVKEPGQWEESLKWAGNIKPDASWWHKNFPIILLELENTVGIDGDAILQAVVDYSKIISQEKFKDFRGTCNFPIVLIGFTGNRIQVSAAVCAGTIYVSNMCILDLSSGFHSSQNVIQLACVFKALSLCRTELQAYYDGVPTSRNTTTPSLKISALYPNPTFVSKVRPPSLVYRKFMARTGQPTSDLPNLGNTTTVMYIATLNDTSKEVIVKFTARYNKEAHRLLADAGFAPKLHFCELIVGNLYMVVMDRVEGETIWQLCEGKADIPTIVPRQVEEAVSALHKEGIVFGDLRDTNILYGQTDGLAKAQVFLVDFDWAERDGEGRYPATINMANLWERSVLPYGVMQKAHDLWQVERIQKLCVQAQDA